MSRNCTTLRFAFVLIDNPHYLKIFIISKIYVNREIQWTDIFNTNEIFVKVLNVIITYHLQLVKSLCNILFNLSWFNMRNHALWRRGSLSVTNLPFNNPSYFKKMVCL